MTWRRPIRFLARALLAVVLAHGAVASAGSPSAALPAGGVVGNGGASSCDDTALTAALAGGGTVTFNCGGPKTILVTSAKTIAADTTLLGGDVITLTGGSATRLFNVNSGVTLGLQHILLDQAASTGSDGGAIASAGTLHLDSTTIQNSHTDINHSGGAIYSTGPVTLSNSQFLSNTAGSGGALFANFGQAVVTIRGSKFINNQATNTLLGYGGAIWVGSQARLTLTDGQLILNTAQKGGAVYLSPTAAVTLTADLQLDVDSNSVVIAGGAIDNDGGTLIVTHAYVLGNTTSSSPTPGVGLGGGIASTGPLVLVDDQIIGNVASMGAGVYVSSTVTNIVASIDTTSIIGNDATPGAGGGLFVQGQGVAMTVANSSFTGNIAQAQGGGLYRYSAYLLISRSSVTGNLSHQFGAGLYLNGLTPSTGGAVVVRDTTINTNANVPSTTAGAGIENLAQAQLTNVSLKDNTDGLLMAGAAETRLANTVLQNKLANCSGTPPQDDLGNFATDFSPCGFASGETGPDAKLGPEDYDPKAKTYFYRPLAGSPLLGAAITACSLHDQLGALRPTACDSGAVQHNGLLPWLYLPLVQR
jgi:hypothetical protein